MNIKLTSPFDYPTLERVTREDGDRHYVCPEGNKLKSVTTILSATSFKPGLDQWRARVGEKEANRIVNEACGLGTLMHTHLENYVEGIPRPGGNNLVRKLAQNMADQIINRGLPNVSEVWGMEQILYYPLCYAGTTDLVGIHNGEPAIMDYKTARKMKKRDMIDDYYCQAAAYINAHNHMFGTDIKKGVIFMVDRDLKYQEFIIEGLELAEAKDQWQRRLDIFLNNPLVSSEPPPEAIL